MYLRSGFYKSCCSSLMIRVQHNHLLWLRGKKFKLRNPLVTADQEGMIRGPFVTKPFIGILACSYATGGFSGLSAPFFPITPFIVGITVAALIFHFALATLCPCGPLLIWSIFNDRLSASFFFFACLYRSSSHLLLPAGSIVCLVVFYLRWDAINVFCLPFVGQFIIYLLFIFCPQSLLLPSYRLPVSSSIHIILCDDPCKISICPHPYGHHCASSIFIIPCADLFKFRLCPSAGTHAPAIKGRKAGWRQG